MRVCLVYEEGAYTDQSGSYSWRAGFSTMNEPYVDRLNLVSRYKERKYGKNIMLFGRDAEADANARSNIRQMFDGDLLLHVDMLVSHDRALKAGIGLIAGMRTGLRLRIARY